MRFGVPRDPFAADGRTEVFEMIKAWLATSVAFAILLGWGNGSQLSPVQALIIAPLTAGIGFVLHELGHRVVARHYGAQARFWSNDGWLVISIVCAFAGFLIAAPGAVWHSGFLTKKQSGLVAAAGPIVNMVLAVLFLIGSLLMYRFGSTRSGFGFFLAVALQAGFQINSWLAFFNMLPFGPIDGAKILNWSTPVFAVMLTIGVALAFGYDRIESNVLRWIS